jgi:hypothetical protein
VACGSCGLQSQEEFFAEIAIHSRDLQGPLVLVFPKIMVCMNCGKLQFAEEFVVPDNELRLLAKRGAAGT